MRYIGFLAGCVLLCGCLPEPSKSIFDALTTYYDTSFGYSISAPHDFDQYGWEGRISGSGRKSDHALWNGKSNNPDEATVDVFHLNSPCSSSTLGASNMEEIVGTNGKTMWGKSDYYQGHKAEGWDYDQWGHVLCTYAGLPESASVYALCSEKQGKTVVICVTEISDNSALAENIFRTFRWTE